MYYNTKTKKREQLPVNTATISNFNSLPESELREHGYYPITRPPLQDWQEYIDEYTIVGDDAQQGVRDIDLEEYKARKVSEVNAHTRETIISKYSLEDQINGSARVGEINTYAQLENRAITEEEIIELTEFAQMKGFVDTIRAEGKAKKQAIAETKSNEEVYNLMSE